MARKIKSRRNLRVFQYFNKNGILSRSKPKGCYNPSKGTKLTFKGEPDIRIRHCQDKPKKTRAKKSKKSKKTKRSKRK